jgi:hypothetical protein
VASSPLVRLEAPAISPCLVPGSGSSMTYSEAPHPLMLSLSKHRSSGLRRGRNRTLRRAQGERNPIRHRNCGREYLVQTAEGPGHFIVLARKIGRAAGIAVHRLVSERGAPEKRDNQRDEEETGHARPGRLTTIQLGPLATPIFPLLSQVLWCRTITVLRMKRHCTAVGAGFRSFSISSSLARIRSCDLS